MTAVLIATAGGHLTQLLTLAPRLPIDLSDVIWVTVPTAQSRSLLADEQVVWARYGSPRDIRAFASHLSLAERTLRRRQIHIAVSTGASLAPPFMLALRGMRVPCHYIESATRVDGPSLAGRLVSRIPGVHLYTQHERWASARWKYRGSIFDQWQVERDVEPRAISRAVVTTGSAKGFPFQRMVDAAARVLPPSCEVTWQIGDAHGEQLNGHVFPDMSSADLKAAIAAADVVISHAGTGSVITALELGKLAIIVPRRADAGEHVDDHQAELAAMLEQRGLAIVRTPDELTLADLQSAAASRVVVVAAGPFELSS